MNLDAVDVAFTEAAVGGGISTILLIGVIVVVGSEEKKRQGSHALPLLIVTLTTVALIYGTLDMPRFGDPKIHLALAMLSYLPWLLWQIVLANLDVAYRVWHPKLKISPRMIRVPYTTKTSVATVVYANSITLTPGTVTVSVDEQKGEMLVHALSEKSASSLLSGAMQDRIHKLEG